MGGFRRDRFRARFERLTGRRQVLALGMALGLSIAAGGAASAQTSSSGDTVKPCGAIVLAATKWLGGHGVHVHSNGSAEGSSASCGSGQTQVNGVLAGSQWQCVELVNRLYLTRGWIDTTWTGNAGKAFWNSAPSNLVKEARGSISYLGPGDVLNINEFHNGQLVGGHVFVVNTTRRVSSGTVSLVSQNNGGVAQKPAHVGGGQVTVSGAGGGWTYGVIGVIHAP
jgi:hypothetical protein